MSIENNTTAPTGDSNKKDLYSINPDVNGFSVGFIALEEKEPDREQNNNNSDTSSSSAGSNTVVAPTDIGEISSGDIKKVGYVGIVVNTLTPEIKKAIQDRAKRSEEIRQAEADKSKDTKGSTEREI